MQMFDEWIPVDTIFFGSLNLVGWAMFAFFAWKAIRGLLAIWKAILWVAAGAALIFALGATDAAKAAIENIRETLSARVDPSLEAPETADDRSECPPHSARGRAPPPDRGVEPAGERLAGRLPGRDHG